MNIDNLKNGGVIRKPQIDWWIGNGLDLIWIGEIGYEEKIICELEFEADVTSFHPGRPAPDSRDHDDPLYADSGDDEEIEYELFIVWTNSQGKKMTVPASDVFRYESLLNSIYNQIDESIRENGKYPYFTY